MKTFYINRSSNTSADTLLTLGWAEILRIVCKHLGRPDEEILLRHQGSSDEVTLSHELREEQLVSDIWIPFLEPLISAKQDEHQTKKERILQDGFPYDKEIEKLAQLIEQRKKSKDPEMVKLRRGDIRPELERYQAINRMKVPDTFNEIVLRWQSLSPQQQWLAIALLFRLFSQQENDMVSARKDWEKLAKEQGIERKATVTAVQVINPTMGKGSNTSKSHYTASHGLSNFWLLELLKFKGFMLGSAPYSFKVNKDSTSGKIKMDRKIYVIQPVIVEMQALVRMMEQFRQICWSSTVVKQDILASLRLTEVLVGHLRTKLTSRQGLEDWEKEPIVGIARGFDVAYYKDMGSAHATMNVSTINVPNWFPDLTTLAHVDAADELLQEHLRIIRRIEGYQGKEGNDELALLHAYRDFLSGHDLLPFWTFASLYGSYLFRQREHEKAVKRWLPQLTKKGLDILVTHHQKTQRDLSAISQNRGFQHIASAIREATVRAQRRYTQENDNRYEVRYEVRYGLGQELIRKARYRDDFANEINEFLFLYNAETAREEEKVARKLQRRLTTEDYRKNHLRYPVTTADIDQLNDLLDRYPTELIAKMLISYGYARLEGVSPEELKDASKEDEQEMPGVDDQQEGNDTDE
jgi:hypothetical protein